MPNRILRAAIRQSRRWNRLSYFDQSLYIRLLTLVDDYGRYEADPQLIRHEAFPRGLPDGNDCQLTAIVSGLRAIVSQGMATIYRHDGAEFLQLTHWTERIRSASRFPVPDKCEQMTVKCQSIDSQMLASSPSPSPSPTPVSVTDTQTQTQPVELPKGFPKTEDDAIAACMTCGLPDSFVRTTWNLAMGRGGRDSKGLAIRDWPRHAKAMFDCQVNRQAERVNEKKVQVQAYRDNRESEDLAKFQCSMLPEV